MYLKRKVISCRIQFHEEKAWFVMDKIDKKWKNAFFALKSGRLGVFDAQFSKNFQSKPKIWFHQKLLGASTWKTINSRKFLPRPKNNVIKFTLGGEEKIPSPVLIGLICFMLCVQEGGMSVILIIWVLLLMHWNFAHKFGQKWSLFYKQRVLLLVVAYTP